MQVNKKLDLDQSRLLGFKMLNKASIPQTTIGAKIGKGPATDRMKIGAKIGKGAKLGKSEI